MKKRVLILLAFLALLPGVMKAEEAVIVPVLKGIYLLSSADDLFVWGTGRFEGVSAEGVKVPCGIAPLRRELEDRFIGKPLTKQSLIDIKRAILCYWREHDHPVVIVEIPPQEITDGVLQIVVVEGKLDHVCCQGNRWFTDSRMLGYVQLKPGQAITADTLLTDVAWMNRNPFRHTDLIFTPGDEEGCTNVELVTCDRFPLRPYVGGDNTGNSTTGQARWFGGFNWGNAFGCDHILNYQATVSTNINRFQAHSAHYTAPLPWRHVATAFGGYARIEPDLEGFHSTGRSWQASGRYIIPLNPLYKSFLREFSFGFDFKSTNNTFEFVGRKDLQSYGSNVNIFQLYGSYSYGKELEKHSITLSLEAFLSPGRLFGHQKDSDYQELRYKAKNRYFYGRLTLGEVYKLPFNYSASILARVQGANANLLPSEQFGLGGYDTVRGYDEREVNVDNALCLNGELRSHPLCPLRMLGVRIKDEELKFIAFVDYGLGSNVHKLPEEKRYHYLLGVGPGVRYTIGKHVSIRADLGFKLHEAQFSTDKRYRWHVGGMISF